MMQLLIICVGSNGPGKDAYANHIEKFHSHRMWWRVTSLSEIKRMLEQRLNVIFVPEGGQFDTVEKRKELAEFMSTNSRIVSRVVVFGRQEGEPITGKEGLGEPYDWK